MKMRPSDASIVRLGWFGVFLAAVSAAMETTIYREVGSEAVLKPPANAVTEPIKEILWKEGPNKAMEWEGGSMTVESYRQYKERGHLNTTTGEMTIKGLIHSDSNSYTPEINRNRLSAVRLIVLSPVPVPTVNTSCDESTCELTCKGNTAGAGTVTYTWRSYDKVVHVSPVNQYTVHKDDSSSSHEFSCEMKNPISQKTSEPFLNPFNPRGPKISTVITVRLTVLVLLTVVVLLVAFHKWKTGNYFFEKDSKPWEAGRDAPVSNSIPAHLHSDNAEEFPPGYEQPSIPVGSLSSSAHCSF